MKKFSIDLKASDKGERKRAVKYLRGKGIKVRKRSACISATNKYLTNHAGQGVMYKELRYHCISDQEDVILTLPLEWYKLVEIVEGENICKVAFDNMFGNFKSDLETLLEI